MNKRRIVTVFFVLFFSFSIFISFYYFRDTENDKKNEKDSIPLTLEENKHQAEEDVVNRYQEFSQQYENDNIVAFLDIPGVLEKIEPIVQASDNNRYLNYNIYEEKDINGATFLDYRNDISSDRKILIYGHSNSELSLPLSVIAKYADSDFFYNHQIIYLYTKEKVYTFQVFSSYVETDDFDYVNLKSYNGLSWMEHLEKFQNKSEHKTDVTLVDGKKVIVLQTCSQDKKYKNYKRKYRLVFGIEK